MKRAKLVVVVSAFVLSSFALQNPAGTGQNVSSRSNSGQSAPAQSSGQSSPAQSVSSEGVPAKGLPAPATSTQNSSTPGVPTQIFGFRDFAKQYQVDQQFLASPSPARAEQHLKILTAQPHIAGSPEDKATADHVAKHFDIAGMETEEVKYSVWMNRPSEISVTVTAPPNVKMNGPRPEHVDGDPLADNPKVVMPFNGSSPSGDVEAEVVYANYGRPEDFKKLEDLKVDVKGKIVIVRYGDNFRGVKSFVAEEHGAAGVIIYSDPIDDGYFKGDAYPKGPWRPESGVQRGSIQYMFKYPGDPTTPGFASTVDLPESKRVPPEKSLDMPKIPTTPLSY
ncbi:MAG TPA: PA domain-containing protein, partial [Candidatus Angelobacter sp.]